MKKINIGIIGCSFVGGTLKRWLKKYNADNVKPFFLVYQKVSIIIKYGKYYE
jgi:hypothetical protein